ncbi:hypothetical protein DOY81_007171 [Sarcophaga bullata]|nr:hypothetical protein DOY81_007171 [Sarcophaga bullata]
MVIFILSLLFLLLHPRLQLAKGAHPLSQLCVNKNPGDLVAHPYDCRAYVECSSDYEIFYCDSKFHFDNRLKICNWPEFANCQVTTTVPNVTPPQKSSYAPFMALDIVTGYVIDPLTSYDPLNVKCRHFGAYFLPHPLQCRAYFLCAYGHMHEHACGPGTLWHYKFKQCVLADKAECYNSSPEEIQEIEEASTQNLSIPGVMCYPIPPPTLIINSTLITTASLTQISSTSAYTTRTHSSTATPPLSTKTYLPSMPVTSKKPHFSYALTIVCPHKKQSYVAHPKDCSKYFMCIMGNPVLTSCPPGLLWDSKREFCNVARNVKCLA